MKFLEKEFSAAVATVMGAALMIGMSAVAFAQVQPVRPSSPPPEPPAAAAKPSGDNLQAARQELGAAWDAGTAAEQRKTNAVVGVINATNASLTALQKQVSDLEVEHAADAKEVMAQGAEIQRLINALAAEKRAAAIKPNPVLKKQPGKVVGDHGQPLILTTPGMPGIGHLNPQEQPTHDDR